MTAVTRLNIRQQALADYKAGLSLLVGTGTPTLTSIQSDDYRIKTSFYATGRGAGSWVHVVSGENIGLVRRVTTSSPSTGFFTINPALDHQPAPLDAFEWHWLADPDSWNEAINRGLNRYWYLDRVTRTGNDLAEQSLADLTWLTKKSSVTGLWFNPLDDTTRQEQAWGSDGRWWSLREEGGYLTLMTRPVISSDNTVYLEALRQMPQLSDDATELPVECDVELAAAFAYDELLSALCQSNAAALASADVARLKANQRDLRANRLLMLVKRNTPNPRRQPAQLQSPVSVSHPWSAR